MFARDWEEERKRRGRTLRFLNSSEKCSSSSFKERKRPWKKRGRSSFSARSDTYKILLYSESQILIDGENGFRRDNVRYSNSIVPGGLLLKSYSTRLTPFTSFTIRFITLCSTSNGIFAHSAVIKSDVVTARNTTA